jgi:hypothetical protein
MTVFTKAHYRNNTNLELVFILIRCSITYSTTNDDDDDNNNNNKLT